MHRPARKKAKPLITWASLLYLLLVSLVFTSHSCSNQNSVNTKREQSANKETTGPKTESPEEIAKKKFIEENYPLYGLVTGVQLKIRKKPDPKALLIGWVRIGARIRLAKEKQKSPTCNSGWHPIYPLGWVCKGEGIEISDSPPQSPIALSEAPRDAALPYSYYFVKDILVPEYYRLPTRNDQRAAAIFAQRFLELKETKPKRAERFWNGELPQESKKPKVVRKYLDRGFFVAGAAIEERASRKFVRTVRGSYIKLAQVEQRKGSQFSGAILNEETKLPIAWAVRTAQPFSIKYRDDGSMRLVADQNMAPHERLSILPWKRFQRVGTRLFHQLDNDRYLKFWFASVAERIDPPSGISDEEPWIHVDISQQTLVLYKGKDPIYATLVSSGIEGHDTPLGTFAIRSKHIAETMSDLGPEAGDDRYKIEDVPWTQYLEGSIALHGAFWHERFGLRRSHGCINLAPLDAHYIFNTTWPELPNGWHGISTDKTGFKGSKVVITE